MRGERNRGLERVRGRGKDFERDKVKLRERHQYTQTRLRDRTQLHYNQTNWRRSCGTISKNGETSGRYLFQNKEIRTGEGITLLDSRA